MQYYGFNLMDQLPVTNKIIDKGCKNSSDMMCFPYKYTLGYFIEALENGAELLAMWNSSGQCRFRHYGKLQEYTLKNLGYKDFEMVILNGKKVIKQLKELNPELTTLRILKGFRNAWNDIKKADEGKRIVSKDKKNIGIIGEIYTVLEESLNFGIEDKISEQGMNPFSGVTMSNFIRESLKDNIPFTRRNKYYYKASEYFEGTLGGHGIENVAEVIMMVEKKFDGIVWLRPLSCMPEQTVDPIIKTICEENNTPLLTIDVDETNAKENINPRFEAFFELIQSR